jgi:gluconokinase
MNAHAFQVQLNDAVDPLVLALDVGSTGSRAALYDAAGRPVRGVRVKVPHAFTTGEGRSTIDPDQVVAEVCSGIDHICSFDVNGRIAGVAVDTFAPSLVGIDIAGRAVTDCFTYADSRNVVQAERLRQTPGAAAMRERTGVHVHTSYLRERLSWLAAEKPTVVAGVDHWSSLGGYLLSRLLAVTVIGTSAAAWTGLLDRRSGRWDAEALAAAGVTEDQLPAVHDPGEVLRPATDYVARRWPALADATWFADITDGYASTVGTGALDSATVVTAMSTSGAMRAIAAEMPQSVPPGLWCYRIDAERQLLGGALNDVGRAVTWLQQNLGLAATDLAEVLKREPDPTTPVVLPFLTGERSTGWAGHARMSMSGISEATTSDSIARGVLEGVAITYARIADQLLPLADPNARVVVSGGVAGDMPGLVQLLADVLGQPVTPVPIKRSTLHGTALHALAVLAPQVPPTPPTQGPACEPVAARTRHLADLRERWEAAYGTLVAQS